MKKITTSIILALMLLLPLGASAQTDGMYKKAYAEFLEVSGNNATIKATMDQMIPLLRQSLASAPKDYVDRFIDKYTTTFNAKYADLLMPIYQKYFTLEDLQEINTFYKSDLGKKMAKNSPLITSEAAKKGQEIGQQIVLQVMQELSAEGYNLQ